MTSQVKNLQWHTPTTCDTHEAWERRASDGKIRQHPIPNLAAEVNIGIPYSELASNQAWPSPQSRDWKGTSQRYAHGNENDCLPNAIGKGQLNPDWVGWLMGWPIGWESLEPFDWGEWPNPDWWAVDPADNESNKQWATPNATARSGRNPNTGSGEGLYYQARESQSIGTIPRVATGIPNRVNRLKALGNGQVPLCVKVAWEILKGGE